MEVSYPKFWESSKTDNANVLLTSCSCFHVTSGYFNFSFPRLVCTSTQELNDIYMKAINLCNKKTSFSK